MRIAVMQPYLFPYAGYFRLFAEADVVVVYDCVQFPRRGWVHRNRLRLGSGELAWLTLPVRKAPREVLINQLEFPAGASAFWSRRLQRFPVLNQPVAAQLIPSLRELGATPLQFIVNQLKLVCGLLDLSADVVFSGDLEIDRSLRGQSRILAIAKRLGASEYINAPGGRALYDQREFEKNGLTLRFLPDYAGGNESILGRLVTEDLSDLRREIITCSL